MSDTEQKGTDKSRLYSMLDTFINDGSEDGSKSAQIDFHAYLRDKMQSQMGIVAPGAMGVQGQQDAPADDAGDNTE